MPEWVLGVAAGPGPVGTCLLAGLRGDTQPSGGSGSAAALLTLAVSTGAVHLLTRRFLVVEGRGPRRKQVSCLDLPGAPAALGAVEAQPDERTS